MRILISGAGIAGPALAYWLVRYGFQPTIVEKAPKLRSGGYIIDFWGAGFEIADKMGLLPEIQSSGYMVQEVRVVNRGGERVAGFPAAVFGKITGDRYLSLPRTALSAGIFEKIKDKIETIFGDGISGIEQSADAVRVSFEHGPEREFDLVIGADGLHSRVRELVFGPEAQFEKYLGFKAAAFQADGYRPRDELIYVMYTELGRQVARFAMRGGRTMFLFTFADDDPTVGDVRAQKAALRARFGTSGWECPQILDAMDATPELYFDRVSQIRMDPDQGLWTRGRVSLVGDAASCVSLLAGQGSALAMIAAYILAGELHRAQGDYAAAFRRYQERFAPFVLKKQDAALRLAGTFAPKSQLAMFIRNQVMNLLKIGWIANLTFAREFRDELVLPEY